MLQGSTLFLNTRPIAVELRTFWFSLTADAPEEVVGKLIIYGFMGAKSIHIAGI